MDGSNLLSLPPEMVALIISFVNQPTHLKALCLSCKTLRPLANERLYEHMRLDERTPGFPFLDDDMVFTPENVGLEYVRCLAVSADLRTPARNEEWVRIIKLALQLLPRDSLREICATAVVLDQDAITLLSTQQRKLTALALSPTRFNLHKFLESPKSGKDWLGGLIHLSLPGRLETVHELKAYRLIMDRAARLEGLQIDVATAKDEQQQAHCLHDSASEDGMIYTALLGDTHDGVQPRGKFSDLQELTLTNQNLIFAKRTFFNAIDFASLSVLELWYCDGLNSFLLALADIFQASSPPLRHFDCDGEFDPAPMEKFLQSFGGLRQLFLANTGADLNHDCLRNHIETLDILALCIGRRDQTREGRPWTWQASESLLSLIARDGKSLTQLALSMPECTGSIATATHPGLTRFIELLSQVPSLVSMRITNWPNADGLVFQASEPVPDRDHDSADQHDRLTRLNATAYLHQLDEFATGFLRSMSKQGRSGNRLPVLTFGGIGRYGPHDGRNHLTLDPQHYLPATQTNVYGHHEMAAVRVGPEMRYVEPEDDVILWK